jgi:putative holliday junction resolvase
MKILGIDLGKKRIGLALGDTKERLVVGLPTLSNNRNVVQQIHDLVEEHEIKKIIVGLPKTLRGDIGSQAAYTKKWAEDIKKSLGVDIVYEDERLSSKIARDSLISIGSNLSKEDIDQAAAVLILQGYIDKLERSK